MDPLGELIINLRILLVTRTANKCNNHNISKGSLKGQEFREGFLKWFGRP